VKSERRSRDMHTRQPRLCPSHTQHPHELLEQLTTQALERVLRDMRALKPPVLLPPLAAPPACPSSPSPLTTTTGTGARHAAMNAGRNLCSSHSSWRRRALVRS
jgi:hypothetical protein